MSKTSKPSTWLPQALVALSILAVLLSLPEVASRLRAPFYRAFHAGADLGEPPARMLRLSLPAGATVSDAPKLKALLHSLLMLRPAALALDGQVVGIGARPDSNRSASRNPDSANAPLPASAWLPALKNTAPIIVGFSWSDAPAKASSPSRAAGGLPSVLHLQGSLSMPVQQGLTTALPEDWQGRVSAAYLEPRSASPLVEASLFRRMPQGDVPSLAVETLRRALRLADGGLPFVEGVGLLLGKNLILPVSPEGRAPLYVYERAPIASLHLNDWALPPGSDSLFVGRLIFVEVGPVSPPSGASPASLATTALSTPSLSTYAGPLSPMALATTQAANVLGRNPAVTPSGAGRIALAAGLALAFVAVLGIQWFGKGIGLAMTVGLSLLYPGLALVFFLASRWWLPPEFPLLAVWAAALPFLVWPKPGKAPSTPPAPKSVKPAPPPPQATAQPPSTSQAPKPPLKQALSPTSGSVPPSPPPQQSIPVTQAPVAPLQATPPSPAMPQAPASSGDIERDEHHHLVRIGRYKIMRKMGQGSAGEVFEAIDLQMGRRVAVKTMTPTAQLHFDRAFERFLVEARAAGSLNHPHINTIHDFGTAGQISYMVLEYLDGLTLSQWMKAHATPPAYAEVAPWIEQVASALDYAHAHKVIHRDLKPSNLMVVKETQHIKLLDFGVAKFGDVMLTQTGMTVGTPTYMSPEQLQGLKVGPGSDQYTLAVLAYQLLTYRLPYAGQKIPEICNRILKGELTPLSEHKPDLPPALWQAMLRAFSRNPADRYPSCLAFYHALDAAIPGMSAPSGSTLGSAPSQTG